MVVACEGLRDEAAREQVATGAAVLGGEVRTQKSGCGELRKDPLGPPLLRVHARRERIEFLPREPIRRGEDRLMFFVELEG